MKFLLIGLIRLYQIVLSPFLGTRCRFFPSCSSYALMVIRENSLLKALWLIARRLIRCNPYCSGGIDLPPPNKDSRRY